jgi:alkanesulfonate monooxygenase SsuD/methylene tetrahydromethanopterin reductase-like flavin-dependent oxidoreductase (luciferase family)
MKFGIFDHLDKSGVDLQQHYENRLKLAEIYDRAGFHAYHIAEHHGTPLGTASSPSVFLAAVAQRTRRLRFGPLVYTLSLTHPIRIIEEVCMLDQMSGGRLELGIGRGSSPYEMAFFGVNAQNSTDLYIESYDVVMMGLREKKINYEGKYFQFTNVPIELECVQQPTPPIWYGMSRADAVPWAAENSVNIVCQGPAQPVKAITDRYREVWSQHHDGAQDPFPLMGLGRHIVVAKSQQDALRVAKKGFDAWYANFQYLWRANHHPLKGYSIPEDFEEARAQGIMLAGTAHEVRECLEQEIEKSGANYILTRFAFGNLSFEESKESLERFESDVMPYFAPSLELA